MRTHLMKKQSNLLIILTHLAITKVSIESRPGHLWRCCSCQCSGALATFILAGYHLPFEIWWPCYFYPCSSPSS